MTRYHATVLLAVLALGPACSIGKGLRQPDPPAYQLQRMVKHQVDPQGLMNPGKVLGIA